MRVRHSGCLESESGIDFVNGISQLSSFQACTLPSPATFPVITGAPRGTGIVHIRRVPDPLSTPSSSSTGMWPPMPTGLCLPRLPSPRASLVGQVVAQASCTLGSQIPSLPPPSTSTGTGFRPPHSPSPRVGIPHAAHELDMQHIDKVPSCMPWSDLKCCTHWEAWRQHAGRPAARYDQLSFNYATWSMIGHWPLISNTTLPTVLVKRQSMVLLALAARSTHSSHATGDNRAHLVRWITENNCPLNVINGRELRNLLTAGRPSILGHLPLPDPISRVNALPLSGAWTSGHCNVVLINPDNNKVWPHSGLEGVSSSWHLITHLCLISRAIPSRRILLLGTDLFVSYMYQVKKLQSALLCTPNELGVFLESPNVDALVKRGVQGANIRPTGWHGESSAASSGGHITVDFCSTDSCHIVTQHVYHTDDAYLKKMNVVYWGITALCRMKDKEALCAEEAIVCTPSPSPHATQQATNTNIKRHLRCTSRAQSHILGMQQPPDDFAGDIFACNPLVRTLLSGQ
ncbi:hypothetical protein BJV78DRAFT_1158396 [Lactifluus subvellereus]|nr:hypothetical protein BJV78DRAFT_1158396 [Lactifluus subvellereus]